MVVWPCGRNYDPAVNKNFNRINGFILFRRHESNKSGNYELGLLSHNSINREYRRIKKICWLWQCCPVQQVCVSIVLRAWSGFRKSRGRGGFGWVIFCRCAWNDLDARYLLHKAQSQIPTPNPAPGSTRELGPELCILHGSMTLRPQLQYGH